MHTNNLVVHDAGDKRSNVPGHSHAMDAASERLVKMLHVSCLSLISSAYPGLSAKLSCIFDDRDQKILVTKGYIMELQQKIARIEQKEKGQASPFSSNFDTQTIDPKDRERVPTLERTSTPDDHNEPRELDDLDSELANPLSSGPPAFMSAANGRTFYLGTSSNWSFTRRVLSLAHQHLYQDVLPTESLIFDETTYELGWDGLRTTPSLDFPVVPTRDHTMYLINAVKFRCGQLYHLFEEDVFMSSLQQFYSGDGQSMTNSLWYIHFLLILAFGKGFVQPKAQGRKPPGVSYFVKALQLLPDPTALYRDPTLGTEILCCIALYYQCVDFRTSAHNYIGQAMRIAMAQGMHTSMPVEALGHDMVQRSGKIWWTIYILDREMTSLMGLPQSINDRYVQTQLPTFADPSETMSLGMHIKLSQIIAEVNSTIYVINGRINRTFLLSTKTALANIAGLADELRESFPLYLDPGSGISRISAYLHLQYHQCIILATRPLLFCFLKIRFESPESCLESLNASRNVRNLMQMCLESAQNIISILSSLQGQGLLETFLPFDLESVFVSTIILLMGPAIDPRVLESHPNWLEKAYAIFDEMIRDGNQVAKFRRSELQQLHETLLGCISGDQPRQLAVPDFFQQADVLPNPASPSVTPIPGAMPQSIRYDDALLRPDTDLDAECDFSTMLTSAEIMAVADSIESYDTEWVSNAMVEHSIW
ncbi:Pc13g01390 [Penicillium rubens Wisconsin 54-1255]|uniref:Pc13g01390 protein n=1 Tax=Penicillium rubens (strain ATCC 28089 / DSM 1075 / NRRL 1951 / Wisconsin 54-1255) TaxID=500485 RepID=B6H1Q4_PENRW|nr:Pc13g01390 [Penicillium rubens Wisconsin 54-1255]